MKMRHRRAQFGSKSLPRVDRAATPAPGPAGPRKPRRRRKQSIDDVAADQVAALATLRASEGVDDGDDAIEGRLRRLEDATGRLEDAVRAAHPDFDDESTRIIGIETETHAIIMVPRWAAEFLGRDVPGVAIAVPKANIKPAESAAKE
jgi:hypothetical protein